MAPTYAWDFPIFEVAPQHAGRANVVVTVHWRCTASADDGLWVMETGQTTLPFSPEGPFTPFDELTLETVRSWVASCVDVPTLQARLASRLTKLAVPAALTPKPPPWSA